MIFNLTCTIVFSTIITSKLVSKLGEKNMKFGSGLQSEIVAPKRESRPEE